jgi:hypothetical protein
VRRLGVAALVVALVVAGGALLVRRVLEGAGSSSVAARCSFGSYTTDTRQASVAATMVGVVLQRGLPERAAVLVITAAWQESKLRNVPAGAGDRDSVGVLQQRPSQGWGSEEQLADIAYAAGKFLDALVRVPNWQTDPAAEVVQAVQISADGSLYAQHERKSAAMAAALMGSAPAGISCRFNPPTEVAAPEAVAQLAAAELPIAAPQVQDRSVSVPGAAWATAAWFVANADRLGIDRVAYGGQAWTRADGWDEEPQAGTASVVATLAEL